MELQQIVESSLANTKSSLWPWFAPEVILSVTILVMLLARLPRWTRWIDTSVWALVGGALALYYSVAYPVETPGELFTGMLVIDGFSCLIRAIVLAFTVLFVMFTRLSGVPEREDAADFYTLVLGSVIGMCLMISANHLFMVFLAVEMASVPSYALAATIKGRRHASEAGLKYAVYGAGAAGIMLYGISLLAGLTGTAHFPSLAAQLAAQLPDMAGPERMVLALAALMIGVGLAFKLSAFPFHFWCPDVFEGSAVEVGAFLSVASKAAALALLVRVALGVSVETNRSVMPPDVNQTLVEVSGTMPVAESEASAVSDRESPLLPVRTFTAVLVACVAAVTCTFGNLAAYGQTNIKRLLAYSTIAHAGYMIMPVAAALLMLGDQPAGATRAVAALAIYMAVYLFMNLTAFAIVAFLRNALGSEEIADYAGLVQRSPTLVVCMGLAMFSLVGIPPLAGFVGKFAIFASLAEGYRLANSDLLMWLLVIGGINTALSLFYYLRVIKVMAIDPPPERAPTWDWSMVSLSGAYVVAVTVPLILLFVTWGALSDWAISASAQLF